MWEFVVAASESTLGKALIGAIVAALFGYLLSRRGKLVWAVSHQHVYLMPVLSPPTPANALPLPQAAQPAQLPLPNIPPPQNFIVRTVEYWFTNSGGAAIEQVDIILNWEPRHFEIWSPRPYTKTIQNDGRMVLSFPNLASNESFALNMLVVAGELPDVVTVRWKDGQGKRVNMQPMRVWPRWFLLAIWGLILFGAANILILLWDVGWLLWELRSFLSTSPAP